MGDYRRQRSSAIFRRLVVTVFLLLPTVLLAQSAGLPLLSNGQGEITLSVAAGRSQRTVADFPTTSRLLYARAVLGLGGWLDLYSAAGLQDLRMELPDAGISEAAADMSLAYALGVNARFASFPRMGAAFVASVALWRSQPAISVEVPSGGATGFRRHVRLDYDWREAVGSLNLLKTIGVTRWYVGTGGYFIQRLEKRWTVSHTPVGDVHGPVTRGEFRSGFVPQLQAGLDIGLPQGFAFSLAAHGRDRNNFALMVGFSQTGSPR
jgi:hypothetical protein